MSPRSDAIVCVMHSTFERLISSVVRDIPLSSYLGEAIAQAVKADAGIENFTLSPLKCLLIQCRVVASLVRLDVRILN